MEYITHLLPSQKRYYKANLHTHSTISDGRMTPEELKKAYKDKGYSILAITDHDVVADHSALNDPDFLMLTGAEYDISEQDKPIRAGHAKTYHLNCIAKRPDILWQPFANTNVREDVRPYLEKAQIDGMHREYSTAAINRIIARANETGHMVCYNHTVWSLQEYPDYVGLKGLWGMELSNYGCMVAGYGDHDNIIVYRDMVNHSSKLFPLCADDAHSVRDVGGGWIMIGAEKLEYGSVIRALEQGDFYASTGPEIHSLTFDGKYLRITCTDAREVALICGNRFALRAEPIHNDGLLREAVFDLEKWLDACLDLPQYWFCVRVKGPYGHFATTRAYRKEDLFREG